MEQAAIEFQRYWTLEPLATQLTLPPNAPGNCMEHCETDDGLCNGYCQQGIPHTVTDAIVIRNVERNQLYLELHIDDPQRIFGGVQFTTPDTNTDVEIELAHWLRVGDTQLVTISKRPLPKQSQTFQN